MKEEEHKKAYEIFNENYSKEEILDNKKEYHKTYEKLKVFFYIVLSGTVIGLLVGFFVVYLRI